MRVISKKTLIAYWEKHPNAEQALRAWYDEVRSANWLNSQDIKRQFVTASFVAGNRVVFNIRGNQHRLIVAVAYKLGVVYIKFVGTHAEYDRIDATKVGD